jgi:hypothetical protein
VDLHAGITSSDWSACCGDAARHIDGNPDADDHSNYVTDEYDVHDPRWPGRRGHRVGHDIERRSITPASASRGVLTTDSR